MLRSTLILIFLSNMLSLTAKGESMPDVQSNDANYSATHDTNEKQTLPLLFFSGDSISVGYASSFKEGLIKQFHCLFRKDLPTSFPKATFPPYPGESSGLVNLLETCYKIPEFKPDVLMLNAGIHDVNKRVPLDVYLANLKSLVKIVASNGGQMIWVNTTPLAELLAKPNQKGKNFSNERIQEYNRAAKSVMDQNGIPTIDFYAFNEQITSSAKDVQEVYRDVWHQRTEFQKKQGEFLAGQILKIISQKPAVKSEMREGAESGAKGIREN